MTPSLLLASASSRRAELLGRLGLRLEIVPADVDESPRQETPEAYVERVARDKAHAALGRLSGRPSCDALLAADTTVVLGDRILGKPAAAGEARAMIEALAGRTHRVLTAYRLIGLGAARKERVRTVSTAVSLRALSSAEVDAYVGSEEWQGKAGGYAAQGLAAAFIVAIAGSFTNVVGLPLAEVCADLMALGVLDVPAYPRESAA